MHTKIFAIVLAAAVTVGAGIIVAEAANARTEVPETVIETTPPSPIPTQLPQEIHALSAQIIRAGSESMPEEHEDAPATPCPITDEEITMLAKVISEEATVIVWNGERWGVTVKARQAAVGWIAYNRLTAGLWGNTLADVLVYPGAFAYRESAALSPEMLDLARDITSRWWSEQQGEENVGRTIPEEYLYFSGDGRENHFRTEYRNTGEYWGWTLPDPYKAQ